MMVGSRAVSLRVFVSPPPDTVATLVTDVGAFAATFTVSVIAGYDDPAASASLRLQLRLASVQLQPAPAIAVAVSPDGSVSVTVTAPLVATPPLLLTVIV